MAKATVITDIQPDPPYISLELTRKEAQFIYDVVSRGMAANVLDAAGTIGIYDTLRRVEGIDKNAWRLLPFQGSLDPLKRTK